MYRKRWIKKRKFCGQRCVSDFMVVTVCQRFIIYHISFVVSIYTYPKDSNLIAASYVGKPVWSIILLISMRISPLSLSTSNSSDILAAEWHNSHGHFNSCSQSALFSKQKMFNYYEIICWLKYIWFKLILNTNPSHLLLLTSFEHDGAHCNVGWIALLLLLSDKGCPLNEFARQLSTQQQLFVLFLIA